jgi:lipid-binding SYLF domain-containing protein
MRTSLSFFAPIVACVCMIAGCETAPETVEGKADIQAQASAALARAQSVEPKLIPHIQSALAVAVFPEITKGGLVLGGAYGKGVLYEHGSPVGYCDVTQGTIGAQIGGQSYTELLIFKSQVALDAFKRQEFTFNAETTAVAADSGKGLNADYKQGVAVFTLDESGLMGEAAAGGQKFTYQPLGQSNQEHKQQHK